MKLILLFEFYSYSRAEPKRILFDYKLIIIVDKLVVKKKKRLSSRLVSFDKEIKSKRYD